MPKSKPGDPTEWRKGDQLPRKTGTELVEVAPKNAAARRTMVMGSLDSFTSGRVAGDGYLKSAKRNLPDLVVTEPTLQRAASVLLKLANCFREANFRISIACGESGFTRKALGDEDGRLKRSVFETNIWAPARPTIVFIDDVGIGLTVYEATVEKEMVYLDGQYLPVKEAKALKPGLWNRKTKTFYPRSVQRVASKRLCLRAYSPYGRVDWAHTWTEDKVSLTKQLDGIVLALVERAKILGPQIAEADRQAAEERKRWDAERAIATARYERSLIIQAREESLRNLLKIIDKWSSDRKLQDFFDDIATHSVNMNDDARAELLEKVHEAKELLVSTGSVEALMSWVAPPKPPE
ncbi:hypothetical protein ACSFE6_04280 [Pseudomonas baetica]|uniref:hypothetical protein n=1 Tax=Pseudomonas baetica TaxID=674054 RepID=UPI003EEAB29D